MYSQTCALKYLYCMFTLIQNFGHICKIKKNIFDWILPINFRILYVSTNKLYSHSFWTLRYITFFLCVMYGNLETVPAGYLHSRPGSRMRAGWACRHSSCRDTSWPWWGWSGRHSTSSSSGHTPYGSRCRPSSSGGALPATAASGCRICPQGRTARASAGSCPCSRGGTSLLLKRRVNSDLFGIFKERKVIIFEVGSYDVSVISIQATGDVRQVSTLKK